MLVNLFNFMTSAFSEAQTTAISTALTSAVGTLLDTFVDLLPIIALIVGALWGVRFILRQFNKLD